ncbi:MAG TPA: hypothetical protein VN648_04025, partial [Candidatus Methylomirabilis sp.]|nr:hypothetical protein [Candidatus Methylomirabilis sp.]
ADILWHSEVPDFYQLKKEGVWEKYASPEAKAVESTVKDPDGFFTPARLGTASPTIAKGSRPHRRGGRTCLIRASRTALPSPIPRCQGRP